MSTSWIDASPQEDYATLRYVLHERPQDKLALDEADMRHLEAAFGRVDVDDGVAIQNEVEIDDSRAIAKSLCSTDCCLDVLELRQQLGRSQRRRDLMRGLMSAMRP